jgi:signal peptidase I
MTAAAGMLILAGRHERLLSVQTASMLPAFQPGDAVLIRLVAPSRLQPGDIVSYRSAQDPRTIISHRLIRVDRAGRLITAGDAVTNPDPAFSPTQLVGRVTAVAPGLGRLLDMLRYPFSLVLIVYLPAASIIAAEVRRLACIYARPFYSVRLEV